MVKKNNEEVQEHYEDQILWNSDKKGFVAIFVLLMIAVFILIIFRVDFNRQFKYKMKEISNINADAILDIMKQIFKSSDYYIYAIGFFIAIPIFISIGLAFNNKS